ncbi:hypothetical protein Dvina_23930 [Dactylosporangium vinaceum]|uniref:Thiaminase-2/PQQC domain-containing protein n=1 Tax=Dactylosporangium vinaceum TaxID=53362 RepID=A0ABV5MD48_9ACTN|nr:hypothetical protein [Dactylosporangium vinaceum]UAC00832.1 hypothetical protein Dvina_23930 [Dactylosporangium vinaceum]
MTTTIGAPGARQQLLSERAAPLPCVPVPITDGTLTAIDMGWCEHRFTGRTATRMAAVLRHCDGRQSITDVARSLAAPPDFVARAVTALYTLGVVRDANREPAPAMAFQQHLVSVGRTLRTRMSTEADILGGTMHRRRLLGSLVETYHFVAAAPYHIGPAVAHAPDSEVRDALSRLFCEEWRHGRDLRAGLLAAGLTEELVRRCRPLPGTQGVVNFLRALADTDLLSYGICAAVNESPKTDTAIKASWDALIALRLLPAAALQPFRGHELEDEASGHDGIVEAIFAGRTTLSAAEQDRIHASLTSFIATQSNCYRDMKEFYGDAEGAVAWGI